MTRALIFAAAAAALWVMVPGLADPYQSPKLLAMGLVAIAMLLAPVAARVAHGRPHLLGAHCSGDLSAVCTLGPLLHRSWALGHSPSTASRLSSSTPGSAIGAARLGR
jgi:hypothetical protein